MEPTRLAAADEASPENDDRPSARTLAAVEHDLYDALAVVLARTQLMSRRVGAGRVDPTELLAGLAAVDRAARRMTDDVGRLASGETAPRRRGGVERPPEPDPAPPWSAPG